MRPIEAGRDVDDEDRVRRIGDVIDLVAKIAIGAQQIPLAGLARRQIVAAADLRHLRAAIVRHVGVALGGQVTQQERTPRVRYIDDRSAIRLNHAGQRIERAAVVMASIGDPSAILLLNHSPVGTARLKVVMSHEPHVVSFFCPILGRSSAGTKRDSSQGDQRASQATGQVTAPCPLAIQRKVGEVHLHILPLIGRTHRASQAQTPTCHCNFRRRRDAFLQHLCDLLGWLFS